MSRVLVAALALGIVVAAAAPASITPADIEKATDLTGIHRVPVSMDQPRAIARTIVSRM